MHQARRDFSHTFGARVESQRRKPDRKVDWFIEVSWQPSTTKVLPDRFGEVIGSHNVAVFHFYASWNQYDITMDQMLLEIAVAYGDQVFVGSIDTDDQENWERCKELRILNLPAIAVFVNGRHFETVIGSLAKESLNSKVQKWLTM